MYCYSLHGYEENTVLTHEKEFTKEQFKEMCKEAPLLDCGSYKAYLSDEIQDHLVKKYGFKKLDYAAGFFVDSNIP